MIIVRLMGGLGNQLQQYALYRHIEECGLEAALDTNWFDSENQKSVLAIREIEIDKFPKIRYKKAIQSEIDKLTGGSSVLGKIKRRFFKDSIHVCNEDSRIFVDSLYSGLFVNRSIKDLYIEGYFANEFYYTDVLPILREELSFPIEESRNCGKLSELASAMSSGDSISIHLRRGDYLDSVNFDGFKDICTDEYYSSALGLALENANAPVVYIFSDDPEYAREYVSKLSSMVDRTFEAVVVDINRGEDSFFDMYLMSCCRINIVANSTFSFWGARLNSHEDKIMIRPTIHHNKQIFEYENMKKWWKNWVFVSPKGEVFR